MPADIPSLIETLRRLVAESANGKVTVVKPRTQPRSPQ